MSRIEIKYRPFGGGENKVAVDGFDLANVTRGIMIRFDAHDPADINLRLAITSDIEIDTEGRLLIDDAEIPDSIARSLYSALQKRFAADL